MQILRTVTLLDVSAVAGHHAMPAALLFLLSAHFNRLLYIEGNEFKDCFTLNSYDEALQVKNEGFCQLFKLANKGMNK